jgi:hypothetical protein
MTDEFGQLTEKELEVGYWWVTHRLQIKAVAIITVILCIVVLYVNAGILFYKYLAGTSEHQAMLGELTDNTVNYDILHKTSSPNPLTINNSLAIGDASQGYDLVTLVENTNGRWGLKEIEYQYVGSGTTTVTHITSLLPGEKKYLYEFNISKEINPVSAKLFIKRQLWEKVKDIKLLNTHKQWIPPIVQAENIIYQSSDKFFNEAKVTFDLVNNSSYSFWEVEVQALLWQGSRLLGINVVTIDNLIAGSRKNIFLNWPGTLPAGLRPEIWISANSIDEGNLQIPSQNLPSTIR